MAPSLLVAKLQSLRRQNPLQRAMQGLGRLPKARRKPRSRYEQGQPYAELVGAAAK